MTGRKDDSKANENKTNQSESDYSVPENSSTQYSLPDDQKDKKSEDINPYGSDSGLINDDELLESNPDLLEEVKKKQEETRKNQRILVETEQNKFKVLRSLDESDVEKAKQQGIEVSAKDTRTIKPGEFVFGEGNFGSVGFARKKRNLGKKKESPEEEQKSDTFTRFYAFKEIIGEDNVAQARTEAVIHDRLRELNINGMLVPFESKEESKNVVGVQVPFMYQFMPVAEFGTLQDLANNLWRVSSSSDKTAIYSQAITQLITTYNTMLQHGVIHNDGKAANVLVNNQGDFFVADFGAVRIYDKSPQNVAKTNVGENSTDPSSQPETPQKPYTDAAETIKIDASYSAPEEFLMFDGVREFDSKDINQNAKVEAWRLGLTLASLISPNEANKLINLNIECKRIPLNYNLNLHLAPEKLEIKSKVYKSQIWGTLANLQNSITNNPDLPDELKGVIIGLLDIRSENRLTLQAAMEILEKHKQNAEESAANMPNIMADITLKIKHHAFLMEKIHVAADNLRDIQDKYSDLDNNKKLALLKIIRIIDYRLSSISKDPSISKDTIIISEDVDKRRDELKRILHKAESSLDLNEPQNKELIHHLKELIEALEASNEAKKHSGEMVFDTTILINARKSVKEITAEIERIDQKISDDDRKNLAVDEDEKTPEVTNLGYTAEVTDNTPEVTNLGYTADADNSPTPSKNLDDKTPYDAIDLDDNDEINVSENINISSTTNESSDDPYAYGVLQQNGDKKKENNYSVMPNVDETEETHSSSIPASNPSEKQQVKHAVTPSDNEKQHRLRTVSDMKMPDQKAMKLLRLRNMTMPYFNKDSSNETDKTRSKTTALPDKTKIENNSNQEKTRFSWSKSELFNKVKNMFRDRSVLIPRKNPFAKKRKNESTSESKDEGESKNTNGCKKS